MEVQNQEQQIFWKQIIWQWNHQNTADLIKNGVGFQTQKNSWQFCIPVIWWLVLRHAVAYFFKLQSVGIQTIQKVSILKIQWQILLCTHVLCSYYSIRKEKIKCSMIYRKKISKSVWFPWYQNLLISSSLNIHTYDIWEEVRNSHKKLLCQQWISKSMCCKNKMI